jgi:hypothetical protein
MLLAAALGATVAVTGFGCAKTQGRSYGQYWDDHRTASHVKKSLDDAEVYKFPGVNVTAFDRVVQLSGFVQTEAQRSRAGELASAVPGVREVINNLVIQPGGGQLTPTGRTNAPVRMGQPAAPAAVPPSTTTTNTNTPPPSSSSSDQNQNQNK